MNLLYCPPGADRFGERLKEAIEVLGPDEEMETCRSLKDLEGRLRQPPSGRTVAILLAAAHPDLCQLVTLGPLLEAAQVLLILPDRKEETIRMGHRLRPRFVGYMDQGINGVVDVLARVWKGAMRGGQGPSGPS